MSETMGQHSYLVKSVLKCTAVQHAVTGSFSRPGAIECVLAKATLLELTVLSEDGGLVTLCEQPVFGSICDIQLLPWNDAFRRASLPAPLVCCDLLALLSDSSDLAFVGFDRDLQRFVHVGHVDLQNEGFSRTLLPARLAVDPLGRAVAVAAETEHVALFHVSQTTGGKLMEAVSSSATPLGWGHVTWDAIVSVAFVRPSDEDVVNGLLKLAVIVRRDDSPGHEVLILFHDTRDNTTHLWARLPAAVNVCPSSDNFLPLLVLAPPSMPDTLLIARSGDLVALDLTQKGPVAKATWAFLNRPIPAPRESLAHRSEKEGLGFGKTTPVSDASHAAGVRIRTDATGTGIGSGANGTGIRLGETETEVGWELDLRSPDAEKTRLAKRRARGENDRPGNPSDVTFGDWNEADAEPDESSSVVKEGPSMCAWAWRSDGSKTSVALALSLADGGLQSVEVRRFLGTDGWDLNIVQTGGCDSDTCQACAAMAWFGNESVGAFVKGGDGIVLRMGGGLEMAPVAEIPNAAPIVDFQLAHPFSENQRELFACCGEGPTASLRTIRPGISAERLLSTPPAYKGVAGLWAMRMSPRDPHHAFLVMAFVSGTRVLSVGLSFDDVTECVGFQQDATTLACGPITDCHVVQICAHAVHVCAPTHKAHPSGIPSGQPYVTTWRPPDGARISVGAVGANRTVVGLSRPSGLVMLGVELRGAPSARHVALVQLQSCRLDAELSCISLQDGGDVSGLLDDVVGCSGDVTGPSDDVRLGADPSDGPSMPGTAQRPDPHVTSLSRFLTQAGQVCVVGTYRPSVEVFSALPRDGFRLLASIPLGAGTAFQRKGISPLSLAHKTSDVSVRSMSPISGCVPESVLLSAFDRGYLLVGLRNGVLARYEWPIGHMERALSAWGTESTGPGGLRSAETTGLGSSVGSPGLETVPAGGIHTAKMDGSGENSHPDLVQMKTGVDAVGIADLGPSDVRSDGASLPANGGPIAFKQVGEKRIGSAPVSLRPLAYSDSWRRLSDASSVAADASAWNSDNSLRVPDASLPAADAGMREPDARNQNSDASEQSSDASTGLLQPNTGTGAPHVSTALSDVLALSNQPWLLHRSSPGRGRMVTSLISHPTSSHATAVSCEECPQGIVFMTDCCMHLVELDANKKTDVRKLSSPGSPRRVLSHFPSKTLLTVGSAPVESPGRSRPALQCIDPETGAVLCTDTSFTHDPSEKCVSVSDWPIGDTSYVVVGTVRNSRSRTEESPGALLDPESEHLRGCLYIFRLVFPEPGGTPSPAVDLCDRRKRVGSKNEGDSAASGSGSVRSGSVNELRSGTKSGTGTGTGSRSGNGNGIESGSGAGNGNGNGAGTGNGNGAGTGSGTGTSDSGYKLELLGVRPMPGPVLATCSFPIGAYGRRYLIAAAGSHVYLFGCNPNLVSTLSEMLSRLRVIARVRTRFPVTALNPAIRGARPSESALFVGDSSDGVLLYRVAHSFELLRSDQERRNLADVIAAPGDVASAAVVADRDGGVGVTSSPGVSKSPERNLQVDAWFNFGEAPTRLGAGAAFDDETSASPRSTTPPPVDESANAPGKAVFVSTASGGLHCLQNVPPLEHEFLSLVQQGLAKFAATAPLMGNDYAAFRSKGTRAKVRSVLEGDFLSQFLDLTESEQRAVLAAACSPLAAAYSRLVGDEAGALMSEEGVMSAVDGCERLRELAAVLIENL